MRREQKLIFTQRKKEWAKMLERVGELDISLAWIETFTGLCLDRGFRRINSEQLGRLQNIAETDSEAVAYLAKADKKAGLGMLEDLSLKIGDETIRAKAVHLILSKGVKGSRRELDLIIAMADNTPSLFDTKEET